MDTEFKCRPGCGACCIAVSISSPIPGMPNGKPAGVRCIHLDDENKCKIHMSPDRPLVCINLRASFDMCGSCREEALKTLSEWEKLTAPTPVHQ